MKNLWLLLASSVLLVSTTNAQRLYSTVELEVQLSYASVTEHGVPLQGIPRYSPFNFVHKEHVDISKHFGFFSGFSIRNTGFVYKLDEHQRINQRVLSVGMPLGVKIGSMQRGFYLAMGSEIELAINYKQKMFLTAKKTRMRSLMSGSPIVPN